MTVEQVLRRAANRIRKYGWVKGMYGNKECGYCLAGAIGFKTSTEHSSIEEDAFKAVSRLVGTYITDFNDRFCHSADDAIAALEIAADLASESHE